MRTFLILICLSLICSCQPQQKPAEEQKPLEPAQVSKPSIKSNWAEVQEVLEYPEINLTYKALVRGEELPDSNPNLLLRLGDSLFTDNPSLDMFYFIAFTKALWLSEEYELSMAAYKFVLLNTSKFFENFYYAPGNGMITDSDMTQWAKHVAAYIRCSDLRHPAESYTFLLNSMSLSEYEQDKYALTLTRFIDKLKNALGLPMPKEWSPCDSMPCFEVDDYPITDSIFRSGGNYPKEPILYGEGPWYHWGDQVILFHLYTDFYRYGIYHFDQKNTPDDLIKSIMLWQPDHGGMASFEAKKEYLSKQLPRVKELDSQYFVSKKGLALGDAKAKVLDVYGRPDSVALSSVVEVLMWNFEGEVFYDGKKDLKGKRLAKMSYGHHVKLYFQEDKLVAVLLHNDIP